MIVDLPKFVDAERPQWTELERHLDRMERDPARRLSLEEAQRIHYLYQRASAGLARIGTLASEPELRRYLEWLVARAYGEIHDLRERGKRITPWHWMVVIFPRTFRQYHRAFALSLALTIFGVAFGALAVYIDPAGKSVILPFANLQQAPHERVAKEEAAKTDRLEGHKGQFSADLMTHNTQVAITAMALGMTWGIGTIVLLFYNGVILGAVGLDYIMDGQTRFLLGWLLPHGVIEIPAILLAGQAGLVLANALIGWGSRITRGERLRTVSGDLVTLIAGVGIMLVWAGIIEAFLSQYHEPVIPYWLKISFGLVELSLLTLFLARSGKKETIESH